MMQGKLAAIRTEQNGPKAIFFLTLAFEQEGPVWTATCLELGTSTYANDIHTVQNEIFEAIALQLNEVERLGFIDDYLKEHGITVFPIPPGKPSQKDSDRWQLIPAGA
jgi:hypothetical protein